VTEQRTFVDPKTGTEIGSTALARWGAYAQFAFIVFGVYAFGFALGGRLALGLRVGVAAAGAITLIVVLWGKYRPKELPPYYMAGGRTIHDAIARWQQRRRKGEA